MGRRTLLTLAAVLALLVALIFWGLRDRPTAAPIAHAPASPTVAPAATPQARPPALAPAHEAQQQPQPQPVPLPAGETPPALDAPHSKPAPPQKPFTRDETIAKREAGLKLLDDEKARLDDQLAAARKSGDTQAAHDLEIRAARVADVRKKRAAELQSIRSGGEVPQ